MNDEAKPVLDKGFVKLIDTMPRADSIDEEVRRSAIVSCWIDDPVIRARIPQEYYFRMAEKDWSYDSTRRTIRFMMQEGHTSPFEHVKFKFLVRCPLYIARQWMRHRTWSYNEESRRYLSGDDIPFQFHDEGSGDTPAYEGVRWYNHDIGQGVPPEKARSNLPQSMYTMFTATVDLHNLFHFLTLRLDEHAQQEIREYANAIAEIVREEAPFCWEAFEDFRLNNVTLSALEAEKLANYILLLERTADLHNDLHNPENGVLIGPSDHERMTKGERKRWQKKYKSMIQSAQQSGRSSSACTPSSSPQDETSG